MKRGGCLGPFGLRRDQGARPDFLKAAGDDASPIHGSSELDLAIICLVGWVDDEHVLLVLIDPDCPFGHDQRGRRPGLAQSDARELTWHQAVIAVVEYRAHPD